MAAAGRDGAGLRGRDSNRHRANEAFAGLALAPSLVTPAAAQDVDATGFANAAQNPTANMISVRFPYNINLEARPLVATQQILNVQPVYPINLNAK